MWGKDEYFEELAEGEGIEVKKTSEKANVPSEWVSKN